MTSTVKADAARPMDLDDVMDELAVIVHQLRFLDNDLEFGLCPDRAIRRDGKELTFIFQQDANDATLWLSADAWRKAKDLHERIHRQIEAEAARRAS